jgi:hypothetical protein
MEIGMTVDLQDQDKTPPRRLPTRGWKVWKMQNCPDAPPQNMMVCVSRQSVNNANLRTANFE